MQSVSSPIISASIHWGFFEDLFPISKRKPNVQCPNHPSVISTNSERSRGGMEKSLLAKYNDRELERDFSTSLRSGRNSNGV